MTGSDLDVKKSIIAISSTKVILGFVLMGILVLISGLLVWYSFDMIQDVIYYQQEFLQLLIFQHIMQETISEIIYADNFDKFSVAEEKYENTENKFKKQLRQVGMRDSNDFNHSSDISSLNIYFDLGAKEIIDWADEKLTLQKEFEDAYSVEKSLRYEIREFVYALEDPDTIQNMGDIQYYGKETLYQHKDKEHLDEWIRSSLELKTKLSNEKLTDEINRQIISDKIDEYVIISENIGLNAIRQKQIHELQNAQLDSLIEINNDFKNKTDAIFNEINFDNSKLIQEINLILTAISVAIVCILLVSSIIIKKNLTKN